MKHRAFIWPFAALAVVVVLMMLAVPRCGDKGAALGQLGNRLVHTDHHQIPLVQCGGHLLRAEHNLEVIERCADLAAARTSGTSVYVALARIAADADHECPLLPEVVDLASRLDSDSDRLLAVAEAACRVTTPEQERVWREYYDALATLAPAHAPIQ
jgi:hypothetical protein